MKILNITQNNYLNYKNNTNQKLSKSFSCIESDNTNFASMPSYAYKANFIPAFGSSSKFKNIGYTFLNNKRTGEKEKVFIQKAERNQDRLFKITKGNNELGFMHIDMASVFPEDDYVLTTIDNIIPKVSGIYSFKKDEYDGIGTALINIAVNESIKNNEQGYLWLEAAKSKDNVNPIPFYYKLGFRAVDKKQDEIIQYAINKSSNYMLPSYAVLILTPEGIEKSSKYYSIDKTFK